jgi:hypothetical protein
LTKPPRDLTQVEFQAQMNNDQLRQSIRIGKGQMPAFGGIMADDEIADVIAFVRTLVPPGSLPPELVPPGVVAPPGSLPGAVGGSSPAPAAPPPTAQGGLRP